MSENNYDLIVIGAGPGGYVAAIRAAQLGFSVAVVEKRETLGGVCLNEGCIPSKALLESSEQFAKINHDLAEHGIEVLNATLKLDKMMARKDGIVKKLTGGVSGLMKKNKIEVISGIATLTGKDGELQKISVGDQEYSCKNLLLATGSEAIELPHLKFDGETIISAREALSLSEVPERLLVVGGGVIGLEMGSVWSRLGAQVTVVEMLDQLIPLSDPQLGQMLQRSLKKQGLSIHLKTKLEKVEKTADGVVATLTSKKGEEQITIDKVLVATGRRAQTEGLGLETVGLEPNKQGQLDVDENYQTSVPGIYAIGDLIAGPMLAHKASEEGVVFAERLAGQKSAVNYNAIPSVTYTHPEVASVGRSEEGLKQDNIDYNAGKFFFAASGRALASGSSDGFVKVLATPDSGRILGIHIIGPHASELIAEATTLVNFNASIHDVAVTCHAHPTLAEAIKEAALAVNGEAIHA
ncbi:dihydrolipoamide dehydrogenase [Malonomonas rubra DSM 5091]|uniref:Dihydrolipoyl dehydrogenase n=1 Tax=Malonomonas rubra DSM 5091 TaxID=1122189 RepID=A0A1M6F7C5_MALRU|nr:dihydrolipoyl dehydrogenase [Malonomonas rubra]SHI93562.1 dihydrolipoamide dehydrogenase [Malonomonas rubra DSM 5091]